MRVMTKFPLMRVIAAAVLLGSASAASQAAPEAPGAADEFRWTPGDPPGGTEGFARTTAGGLDAVLLAAEARKAVDISALYPWNEATGPLTLRLVFQLTKPPRGKTPLLSKWRLIPGGRSLEVGLMPDGRPYFDVSGSGHWDGEGLEIAGACRLLPGKPYAAAAVFEPGARMALFVNGRRYAAADAHVPARLCPTTTPVLLGAQPPGDRWADAAIALVLVDRRVLSAERIAAWAAALGLTDPLPEIEPAVRDGRMDLTVVRRDTMDYLGRLQVEGAAYGVLRQTALDDAPVTLYASCDAAWTRACMGEELVKTLTPEQRRQWIAHINSFAHEDGTYTRDRRHSLEHGNGMVIGALAVLGGRQEHPVSLYESFDEEHEIAPWLERIRWDRQWSASHLFWGGMHCYSMSRRCTDAWRTLVFQWLDDNLDPATGWWRKGVPQAGLPIEVLGGAAHIWPIYQHHSRPFPYPERVIDSILAMQRADGAWLGFSNYMDLDALYGLAYMRTCAPNYRAEDIAAAARRHGRLVMARYPAFLPGAPDVHTVLALIGTLALLQELAPESFRDTVRWSDIFSDRRFYRTDLVEAAGEAAGDRQR